MTLKEENAILLESLKKMIGVVYWFTDSEYEGQSFESWQKVKPHVEEAQKLVDSYVKKEDNYYEETANDKGAKDTDEMSVDIIPGTDMMYRPYREPLIDNSAIENHETAGQDSDGQNTGDQIQYQSTETSV